MPAKYIGKKPNKFKYKGTVPNKNPGAAWHKKEAIKARKLSRRATTDTSEYYHAGWQGAHEHSAKISKQLNLNPAAKTYVGITHQAKPKLFTSAERPTMAKLGRAFMTVYGPFKTYTDAEKFEDRLRKKHRMNPGIKWYAGVIKYKIETSRLPSAIVFGYSGKVIENKFGELFNFVFGPYKTENEAIQVAKYQGYQVSLQPLSRVYSTIKLRKSSELKKNPELGKILPTELLAIDMANEFGAKGIKQGMSNIRAIFKSITNANKFVTWLTNRNYSYRIGTDKNNLHVVSFASIRKNPVRAIEIYDNILAIEAKKGKSSLWPGEKFRHDFKKGGKIFGLGNGSLLIKPRNNNQKLWKNFNY